jgi:hypothetical protein
VPLEPASVYEGLLPVLPTLVRHHVERVQHRRRAVGGDEGHARRAVVDAT